MIKSAAGEQYGDAADAYLAAIASRRAEVESLITVALTKFMSVHSPKDADGQVLRAVRRFALVGTAGEIAIKLGVLPWPPGHAFKAAAEILRAWLGRRGGTGSAEDRNIIAQFRAFFEAHAETRFDPADPQDGVIRPVLNRAGFWKDIKLADGIWERQYFVLPQAFREIGKGFDLSAVTAALAKIGALRTIRSDGRGCDNRRIKALDGKLAAVYAIGPEIFETGEDVAGDPL